MKSKHTPGPWTFSGQKGPVGNCIKAQVWDSEGHNLSVIKSTKNPEEATANAKLIAAAPEMLEVLEEVVNGYEWRADEWPEHWDKSDMEHLYKIKELIKKATGDE